MHGYQIIRELGQRSAGAWQPSPGSVYPTLQQLQDEGLVRSTEADGGKRVFELTDEGRTESATLPSTAPWEDAADEATDDLIELNDAAFQLIAAARQVAQGGDPRQIRAANEILRDARRRVYRLLAEDGPGRKTANPRPDGSGSGGVAAGRTRPPLRRLDLTVLRPGGGHEPVEQRRRRPRDLVDRACEDLGVRL